jgi:hypothetical protein
MMAPASAIAKTGGTGTPVFASAEIRRASRTTS